MTTIALDNRGGNHSLARADYDHIQCPRCGIWRKARPGATLCADCKTVEHHARRLNSDAPAGRPWTYRGVTTWATPMSDEDRRWCEQQANCAFWGQWAKFNRTEANPLQPEAVRRAQRFCTESPELSTLVDSLSTHTVDNTLHEISEQVFDEGAPDKEGAA